MNNTTLSYPSSRLTVNPWLIAAIVVVPTFMEVLDTTIAVVALRYIDGGLSATVDDGEWGITSYLAAKPSFYRSPAGGPFWAGTNAVKPFYTGPGEPDLPGTATVEAGGQLPAVERAQLPGIQHYYLLCLRSALRRQHDVAGPAAIPFWL